ncbi:MAG: amidohydrolase family protein [Armatimonadota bacterium]
MATPIIDARVHVSRATAPWPKVQTLLRKAGIDSALLSMHPETTQPEHDMTLPRDVAAEDGPWAAYYVGGLPFEGYRRGPAEVPADFDRYSAVHIRSFLSPSLDFGGATTSAHWDSERLEEAVGRDDLAAVIDAAHERDMPVWLIEHFPVTLALIERFPGVRFVIPKMGAMNGGSAAVVNALAGHAHICFDTSGGEIHESIVKRLGFRRILFASGYPFNDPADCLDQLCAMDLHDEEIGAMAGGNFLELIDT